jgi:hypothetical protein
MTDQTLEVFLDKSKNLANVLNNGQEKKLGEEINKLNPFEDDERKQAFFGAMNLLPTLLPSLLTNNTLNLSSLFNDAKQENEFGSFTNSIIKSSLDKCLTRLSTDPRVLAICPEIQDETIKEVTQEQFDSLLQIVKNEIKTQISEEKLIKLVKESWKIETQGAIYEEDAPIDLPVD